MAKQLIYAEDARAKLKAGVDAVAKAVVTTLGPRGRNVALDQKWGAPNIVHDGVTVAKEIELKDPFENMGAQLVKEAASKTNDTAGDGTTTSTLLAAALVEQGWKAIIAGVDPMEMKREVDRSVEKIIAEIKKMAKPIKNSKEISQVATISAGDEKIGELITEALEKVGKDGVVTVEEGRGFEMDIDYKEGMEFDKGYTSPYFITDTNTMESEIENPYILITDKKISAISDLLPFLEKVVKITKNLVIISEEIEGEALATLVVNKLRGAFNILAIEAPGFGDRRKAMLEDMAILTGGTLISEDTGRKLESIEPEDCGQAEKVWADKENCRIIGGKGSTKEIKARISSIRKEMEASDSDFDVEKLQERLAKLSGGVAQINVGAATEIELNEKKERVKDAVEATKAAVEEGIVPGGGIALLRARSVLVKGAGAKIDEAKGPGSWRDFETAGEGILYNVLQTPLAQIVGNARANIAWVVKEIEEKGKENPNYGFNVKSMKFGDMIKEGVVDPAKVVRLALQNAASVATMILTTECLVVDEPKTEEDKMPQMPAGGMGGMPGM